MLDFVNAAHCCNQNQLIKMAVGHLKQIVKYHYAGSRFFLHFAFPVFLQLFRVSRVCGACMSHVCWSSKYNDDIVFEPKGTHTHHH